jgi:hypothetical protein
VKVTFKWTELVHYETTVDVDDVEYQLWVEREFAVDKHPDQYAPGIVQEHLDQTYTEWISGVDLDRSFVWAEEHEITDVTEVKREESA